MKELKGTEKQIAWATQIRDSNVKELKREIEEFKLRKINGTGSFPELIAKLGKALQEIEEKDLTASWWIEHKGLAASFIQRIKK